MAGIYASGKIRLSMLCYSVFLFYSFPSLGAPPQQLPEQHTFSDTVIVSPGSKPPLAKAPVKGESLQQIYVGTKQSHPEPANGKIPPKPRDSIRKHKNPVDMSTGKDLLPMPVEPK